MFSTSHIFYRYATVESTVNTEAIEPPSAWTQEKTVQWLKKQIQEINSGKTFDVSADLFEQGLDRCVDCLTVFLYAQHIYLA